MTVILDSVNNAAGSKRQNQKGKTSCPKGLPAIISQINTDLSKKYIIIMIIMAVFYDLVEVIGICRGNLY